MFALKEAGLERLGLARRMKIPGSELDRGGKPRAYVPPSRSARIVSKWPWMVVENEEQLETTLGRDEDRARASAQ